MPFHPTHINREDQFNRRHSYADLLRYPQRYKMHWRLWNGGTARVLLWGDPGLRPAVRRKHAPLRRRRFRGERAAVHEDGGPAARRETVRSAQSEVPLLRLRVRALLAFLPGVRPHRLQPADARRTCWQREFERRFGKDAAPVRRAGACTGRVGFCRGSSPPVIPYGYFPMTRGWAEKQRLGDLPTYAKAEGSDIAAVRQLRRRGEEPDRGHRDRQDAARRDEPLVREGCERHRIEQVARGGESLLTAIATRSSIRRSPI